MPADERANADDPRIEAIFAHALELDDDRRPAYLIEACGGDGSLRDRVETLLDSLDRASRDGFLESPTAGGPGPGALEESPGSLIGPYRIVSKLGEGGFGAVYRAEQTEPVSRWVALKIIKLGMDTAEVIGRFEAERRALALMDHPNIARVFDAGATDKGRPYFAMELVEGVPITRYCDEHRLSLRDRLALIAGVCRAVQHAHAKGVIHRDIKPSNVLIAAGDHDPIPKVIDFGIAKATDARLTERTMLTRHNQLIGTPEYMSPEQATAGAGDIDTRTDVYSLGVLLYELLTGVTPFDAEKLRSAAFGEIERIIREQEPPKPSTRLSAIADLGDIAERRGARADRLGTQLRGELDWIVMRALEKDRARRYQTPTALAEDIDRYLRNEPVEASPPSRSYRARKFVSRNRAPVIAGAAMFALLAAGVAGTTTGLVRERAERQRTEAALSEAEAVTSFFVSMLEKADPKGDGGGSDVTVRQLLDAAAPDIGSGLSDAPQAEARVRFTVGTAYRGIGALNASAEQLEQAVAINQAQHGPDAEQTLEARSSLANTYANLGRYEEAELILLDVIEARTQRLGPAAMPTLEVKFDLALSYLNQARDPEADALFSELTAALEARGATDKQIYLGSLNSRGLIATYMGEPERAGPLYEQSLEVHITHRGIDHPATLTVRENLALHRADQGESDEAFEELRAVSDIRREVLGPEHPETLTGEQNFAARLYSVGEYQESADRMERILEATVTQVGQAHPRAIYLMGNLGNAYMALNRLEEAYQVLDRAVTASRTNHGPDNRMTLSQEHKLGQALVRLGRFDEAVELLTQTVAFRVEAFGPGHDNTFNTQRVLALAHAGAGDAELAERELLDLIERHSAPDEPAARGVLEARSDLGSVYLDMGRLEDARFQLDIADALENATHDREVAWLDHVERQIEFCKRQGREEDRRAWEAKLPD